MKILVVEESAGRADLLVFALREAGYQVAAALSSPMALLKTIDEAQPEVIVIDTDSPSRDVIEHVATMTQHTPRPVVMFARDPSESAIRKAVRAGVSAYIVDGTDATRVRPVINAAVAHFEELQRLRRQLAERALVERAKAILMRARGVGEARAYELLRKSAMDRKVRIGVVAQQLIDAEAPPHGA